MVSRVRFLGVRLWRRDPTLERFSSSYLITATARCVYSAISSGRWRRIRSLGRGIGSECSTREEAGRHVVRRVYKNVHFVVATKWDYTQENAECLATLNA